MRKRLLTTHLYTVEQRVYACSGHSPVTREIVVHPGAVVMLPVLKNGRIVFIRNYRYSVEQQLWELPAGTIEPDEKPLDTARRELEEETGYRAATMTPLMEFYTSPGICTERMHAFVATDLTRTTQRLQSGEQITVEELGMDDVRRGMIDGLFCDGKTLAVLGRYLLEHHGQSVT